MYEPVHRGNNTQSMSEVNDGTASYHSSRTGSSVQQVQLDEASRQPPSYAELTNVLRAPKLSDRSSLPSPSQSTTAGQVRAEFPVKLCPAPFATSILRGNSWTVQAHGNAQIPQTSATSRLRLSAAFSASCNSSKAGTQHGITTFISRQSGMARVGDDKRWVDEDITHYGAIEENCDDFDEWVERVDVSKFAKDISIDLMSRPRLIVKKERSSTATSPYPKPGWSYSNLIALALKNSTTGQLTVSEIYAFMLEHFPYFRTAPSGWKNSVRHNLSLNKCFCKVEIDEDLSLSQQTRKSCLWMINPQRYDKIEQDIRKWRERNPDTATEGMACPEDLQAIEDGTKGLPTPERNSRQVLKTAYFENRALGKQPVNQVNNSNRLINSDDAIAAEDLLHIVKEGSHFQWNTNVPSHSIYASAVKPEPHGDRISSKSIPDEDLLPTTFPPTETLIATTSFNPAKRSRPESAYNATKEVPVMDLLPNTFMDAFLSITPPKSKEADPDASLSPVRESGFRDAHDALNDNSLLAAALEQSPYKLPVTFPVL